MKFTRQVYCRYQIPHQKHDYVSISCAVKEMPLSSLAVAHAGYDRPSHGSVTIQSTVQVILLTVISENRVIAVKPLYHQVRGKAHNKIRARASCALFKIRFEKFSVLTPANSRCSRMDFKGTSRSTEFCTGKYFQCFINTDVRNLNN
jgi:hypothetical protein